MAGVPGADFESDYRVSSTSFAGATEFLGGDSEGVVEATFE